MAAQSRATADFSPPVIRAKPRKAKKASASGPLGQAWALIARHPAILAQAAAALMVAGAAIALFERSGLWGPAKEQPRVEAPLPPARPVTTQPAPAAEAKPEEHAPVRRAEVEAPAAAKPAPQNRSLVATRDAAVDAWFIKAYLKCWSPPAPLPPGEKYSAKIRVTHNADGSLDGPPRLVNPPSDPAWRPYADSAVRAVKKCNPLKTPEQYQAKFDQWRKMTLDFAPDSAVN